MAGIQPRRRHVVVIEEDATRRGTVAAMRIAVVLVCLGLPCLADVGAPRATAGGAPAGADVQRAIQSGKAWLEAKYRGGVEDAGWQCPAELVLLTLAHAGGTAAEPVFAKSVKAVVAMEPRWTYRTACLAMALAEINPRLYQAKIAHCAQWLVDTQVGTGEWGYVGGIEERTHEAVKVSPPRAPEGDVKDPDKPREKIVIRAETTAADKARVGDTSNTQFAILGLRAAREAGVEVPATTWKRALDYLRKTQREDGGWGYVTSGRPDEASYASLTAASACSVAICLNALGAKDPKSDSTVRLALSWLAKNPDPGQNTGHDASAVLGPSPWQCYHLYSVERAGRVLGLDEVGGRSWYDAGAAWLLSAQKGDGHWEDDSLRGDGHPEYMTVADTCFALLFLTRATRPLTTR